MQTKKRYEVIIYGRGGQGAKTTAEIIVQAAVKMGKYVQAFPEYGPERSGAPIRTFVRISDEPIRTHEPIWEPDFVLILDESILDNKSFIQNLNTKQPIIVNTNKSKHELNEKIGFSGKLVTIDATGMSKEIIGENRPNTVILGKFAFVTEIVTLQNIIDVFKEKYASKLGAEKTAKNLEAIRNAYDSH